MLITAPAVFAVETSYQIMVKVKTPSLFWVRVGNEEYYDESNGIMCSMCDLHRVTVPMSVLDEAKAYTVCVRPLVERKPYFTQTEDVWEETYSFSPIPDRAVRAYHISDAHNRIDGPIKAAKAFGDIDLLILNGDILNHSGDPSQFDNVYTICDRLTGGHIPVIFSRGNHDMRGNFAEQFATYTPNANGHTYYTFRLGHIWGICLDCGEDKPDDHEEYGHTVCCHAFRKRQTAFLKEIIRNKEREYAAPDVTLRLVISHNPFTFQDPAPFNIEADIYSEWATLLKEEVHPDLMICGHTHRAGVFPIGGANDHLGQPCPLVVGAMPLIADDGHSDRGFVGCGFVFGEQTVCVEFTDDRGNRKSQHIRK